VFAPAFWNGRDPMLKERLFGLTCGEGNRGEDVKEYYFYLDNTPTHSYMRMLYKYPQAEYPYERLVEEAAGAQGHGTEFELSTRASSTRIATSMSSSSTRRRRRRHLHSHRSLQPRDRCCRAPRHPASVVSQYLGVGPVRGGSR
jgi:hypothetical protein